MTEEEFKLIINTSGKGVPREAIAYIFDVAYTPERSTLPNSVLESGGALPSPQPVDRREISLVDSDLFEHIKSIREAFNKGDRVALEDAINAVNSHYINQKLIANKSGVQSNQKQAEEHIEDLAPLVLMAINEGAAKEEDVANYFNNHGKTTRRGNPYNRTSINRLIKKAQEKGLLSKEDIPFQKRPKGEKNKLSTPSNK